MSHGFIGFIRESIEAWRSTTWTCWFNSWDGLRTWRCCIPIKWLDKDCNLFYSSLLWLIPFCWLQLRWCSGWWFGTFFIFSIYWEFHHPNWLFFRGWLNHQPVYFGQWWFNQSQIRTMVVYLPTKLDVWGKCWDSYSNTMVRIWGSSTTNQINYLYIIYILGGSSHCS